MPDTIRLKYKKKRQGIAKDNEANRRPDTGHRAP